MHGPDRQAAKSTCAGSWCWIMLWVRTARRSKQDREIPRRDRELYWKRQFRIRVVVGEITDRWSFGDIKLGHLKKSGLSLRTFPGVVTSTATWDWSSVIHRAGDIHWLPLQVFISFSSSCVVKSSCIMTFFLSVKLPPSHRWQQAAILLSLGPSFQ